LFLLSFRTVI